MHKMHMELKELYLKLTTSFILYEQFQMVSNVVLLYLFIAQLLPFIVSPTINNINPLYQQFHMVSNVVMLYLFIVCFLSLLYSLLRK